MSSPEEDRSTSPSAPAEFDESLSAQARSLMDALGAGLSAAVVVTFLVSALEGWSFLRKQVRDPGETGILWDFVLWGVGKSVLGNLIFLGAVGLLLGGLAWVVRQSILRRRLARADGRPLAAVDIAILPLLTGVAGFTLLPFVLEGFGKGDPLYRSIGWVSTLLVALALSVILRRFLAKGVGVPRWRWRAPVLILVFVSVPLFMFWRSPYFDPAGYSYLGHGEASQRIRRTNVVWLVLDTVTAQRMSLYGYERPTTPFLDDLASKEAIVFDRAASNGIWTVPSHSSMFTGLPVRAHGAGHPDEWLAPEFPTVASVLGDRGWQTRSVVGNTWLSRTTDIVRGFEFNTNIYKLHGSYRTAAQVLFDTQGWVPPVGWLDYGSRGAITNREAARWLDSRAGSFDPFFLFVNYMDAHLLYQAPIEYRRRFMSEDDVRRSYEISRNTYGTLNQFLFFDYDIVGEHVVLEDDRRILATLYDASIAYLDDRLKEFYGLLEERGLLDNTLLIITADHGEYLGAHQMWSHHFLAYDGVAHVPLILRPPGGAQPTRVKTPVQLSDLYETVLNATLGEGEVPVGRYSEDLLALASQDERPRWVVTEFEGPDERAIKMLARKGQEGIEHYVPRQTAVRDGQYLYLESDGGRRELYDLIEDPGETVNLIDQQPEVAARLAGYLAEWREQTPVFVPSPDRERGEISADDLDALRALGYVG